MPAVKRLISILFLLLPVCLFADDMPSIKNFRIQYNYELQEVSHDSRSSRHCYTYLTVGTLNISFDAYNCTSVHIRKSQPYIRPGERIIWSLITPINCTETPILIEKNFNGVKCGTWIEVKCFNDITGETYVIPPITVDSLIKDEDMPFLYNEQDNGTSEYHVPDNSNNLIQRHQESLIINHDRVEKISIISLTGITLYQENNPTSDVVFNLTDKHPILIVEILMHNGQSITKKIIK